MSEQTVAIFDQAYFLDSSDAESDFWHAALNDRHQERITGGHSMRQAAKAITMMTVNPDVIPSTIFVGERLSDHEAYITNPTELGHNQAVTAKQGRLRSAVGRRAVDPSQSLVLLPGATSQGPFPAGKNKVELPILRERHRVFDLERAQQHYLQGIRDANAQRVPAPFIIANAIRILFPERDITIVAVSNESKKPDIPVDIWVQRTVPEAGRLHRRLSSR